jgi:hypothetical protein
MTQDHEPEGGTGRSDLPHAGEPDFFKTHSIRLSGPALGRPVQGEEAAEQRRVETQKCERSLRISLLPAICHNLPLSRCSLPIANQTVIA